MPEGDTIYRTADVMRRTIGTDAIVAARGRPGGVQLQRVVGSHVAAVRTRGKHLLIDFDGGLTLHTHLQMHGSWHRYGPGERWRAPADEAVAVLETVNAVAVCFEAPTVELVETRALPLHPVLSKLGPDLLDPEPDIEGAVRRLRASQATIAEALLDQRLVAGIGNVYRSEILAYRVVPPFTLASGLGLDELHRIITTASEMLRANLDGGVRATVPGERRGERWVYRRAGRPCRRCSAAIESRSLGQPPRRVYWCPACQARRPLGLRPKALPRR